MFTVTVELLAGRYVATHFNDRSKPEWPPHPARLFSAAVAAWADHGDMDDGEREALEWWETLAPPAIRCSLGAYELAERSVVTHFVPVNDTAVVSRDTARTYLELVAAERSAADPSLDAKQQAKALKRLDKARTKASADSEKATTGIAPEDRLGILPDQRSKQARTYPTVIPADPTVDFHWDVPPSADPSEVAGHLKTLDGILARVARLGHSSTPVSVTLRSDLDSTTARIDLEPGHALRTLGLRVPTDGQVESLIRAYEGSANGTEPRTMPARIVSYRRPQGLLEPPLSNIGERWLLLRPAEGSRLMVQDIPAIAKTLRSALMSVAGENGATIPETISGHAPRGNGIGGSTAPSSSPHMMILGLPFADHRNATGEVMGIAVVLPPSPADPTEDAGAWSELRKVVGRFLDDRGGRLTFRGGSRPIRLRPADLSDLPGSARVQRWSEPATSWTSVTPVALHRNPGPLGHADSAKRDIATANAEAIIATSCEHIGLPRPIEVEIFLDAPTRGTRPVHAFPPARTGKLTRVQVHARITFDEPVGGPIVLGAGRFHGLGLFSPSPSNSSRKAGVPA